ncbi:MlaD family protein [Idiomarina aminovorans]|uniref:MlaD family protein n=1 Tax=Idiomarina aminovorans TaxID=2914829 RepID=UPI002003E759|nr:MlaD family protein [Idiomarina sp. ATCH4]MCK7460041.1 MlaD family protein [Idiomarina sp. ATCH4]
METKAHHVLIGSFVLIISAAFISVVFWLGKTSIDSDYTYYEVIFNDEVSGLNPGSAVEYSGIKVGDVVNLRLDPNDPRVVRVRIRVSTDTPIKDDTGARLGLANITGNALIRLYGGSPESPPLNGSENAPAVIVAERSALNQLFANSESLLQNVNLFVQNINSMFSDENTQRVAKTLRNVESLTSAMAAREDDLQGIVEGLHQTIDESRKSMVALTRFSEQGQKLLNRHGDETFTELQHTLRAMRKGSKDLTRIMNENEESLEASVRGLREVGPAAQELQRTLRVINRIAERLEEEPGSFLLKREQVEEVEK